MADQPYVLVKRTADGPPVVPSKRVQCVQCGEECWVSKTTPPGRPICFACLPGIIDAIAEADGSIQIGVAPATVREVAEVLKGRRDL